MCHTRYTKVGKGQRSIAELESPPELASLEEEDKDEEFGDQVSRDANHAGRLACLVVESCAEGEH